MSNLDALVQSKAQAWLDGDYDEATKASISIWSLSSKKS